MIGLSMLEIKDDHDPLPTREELRQRAADAKARRELERTIEALEQFGRAAAVAAVGIERAMVEFKDAFARLAERKELWR